MQKMNLRKLHFILLIFILINLVIVILFSYRLSSGIIFPLKIVLYLSGFLLFFKTIKPFKWSSIYYSFYVLSALVSIFAFSIGGILSAILASIILFPIYPSKVVYKSDNIKIYENFRGFMSPCCSYEVVIPKLLIFEKIKGSIKTKNAIDSPNHEFILKQNTIIYKHSIIGNESQNQNAKNTTELLLLEK